MRTHTLILLLAVWMLSACAEQAPPPPTAFSLPTLAEIATNTPAPVAAVNSPAAPVDTPEQETTDLPIATAPGTATMTGTATGTPTETITLEPSITVKASQTITDTPSPTTTSTPRAFTSMEQLGQLAARATVLPRDFAIDGTPVLPGVNIPVVGTPADMPTLLDFFEGVPGAPDIAEMIARASDAFSDVATCENPAPGGFGTLESEDFTVRALLGCPQSAPPTVTTASSAYQTFERGFMLWVDTPGTGTIYVGLDSGTYQTYPDTWNADSDPVSGNETPPDAALSEPIRGFGKVWRDNPQVRNALGWATSPERGDTTTYLPYQQGTLLYAPQRGQIIAFGSENTWRGYAGSY
ncbi:MAG: hypothetical protein AAFV33_04060 [Chloroflexota bacterium]